MEQFDVHRNTGKQKEPIPYVVIVQSALFDSYRRRVVVPLVRRTNLTTSAAFADIPLNTSLLIEGIEIILHPLEIVSISDEQLGDKVMSLAQEGDRITAALDELLTRAWD